MSGFAHLSKARKKLIASKGGKAVQELGVGHKFDSNNSKSAAMKGVEGRKKKLAFAAAKRLLEAGFTPEELVSVISTVDEYIYFGSFRKLKQRIKELRLKLDSKVDHPD